MKAKIIILTLTVIMLCYSVLQAQEPEISEASRQTQDVSRKTVFFPLIIKEGCTGTLSEGEELSRKSGEISSAKQALGNAQPEDVLRGKTFSNRYDNFVIGTMPNNRAGSDIICGTSDQALAEGYWSSENIIKGDPDLLPVNIRSGVNIFGVNGTARQSSGNAVSRDVLSGKTFSNSQEVNIAGTMPDNGAGSEIICSTSEQTIAKGYWSSKNTVLGDTDLVCGNIRSGVDIFGVTGTSLQASGTATAGDVLTGKTFSNSSGVNISGTMSNKGAGADIICNTFDQIISSGYWSSANTVKGDADLVPGNIKAGVDIFEVTGTSKLAEGTATAGDVLAGKTFSNSSEVNILGTIPNRGAGSDIICGTSNQKIAWGYWSSANFVMGDTDLVSGNIRSGVNIFGVTGSSLQTSGTAEAGDVLTGKTFSNSSASGIAGTMPDNTIEPAVIISGWTNTDTDTKVEGVIPEGYYNSNSIEFTDSGLIPSNIKAGETIFNIKGNQTPISDFILIFAIDNANDGDLGGRSGADALCQNAENTQYNKTNVMAFISVSADDQICDFPNAPTNIPTSLPIYGPNGKIIANDWNDLLDGDIDNTLQDAGITYVDYWTGSNADGSYRTSTPVQNNCNGWTIDNSNQGSSGQYNKTDSFWLESSYVGCGSNKGLLCVAW